MSTLLDPRYKNFYNDVNLCWFFNSIKFTDLTNLIDVKSADERLTREVSNVSLPSPVVHDVGILRSASSQQHAANNMIWGGHDLVVCETNAAKKLVLLLKLRGLFQ